ncbi:hypothetical protein BDN72DRAFT_626035 [Pluteus cervinus]|uniref:Uncharacterized protein n=1 Tax=Pluteus cervinus TaxID=181527 RepID=A0ACD3AU23_9AGAR|nr:hypothetical protein BDN72DRAFT_626035 [Pluteus cervinus]
MISSIALLTLLAGAALVHADVVPDTPGPGDVFKEGSTCKVTWDADTDKGSSTWKDMSIQLMSGDNFNMVPVTTVTTGADGSASGEFDYPCPDVTPNSPIYFYQFTSPTAANKTWTTRFTIAAADGSTTPPQNAVQPGGDNIPWGVGALTDPSKAVPPPAYLTGASTGSPPNGTAPATSGVASSGVPPSGPAASSFTSVKLSSTSPANPSVPVNSSTATNPNANGAVASVGSWNMGAAVVASVFTLALAL